MSRSGYTDDYDDDGDGALAMYRGRVASATRGKRGQQFLRDLVDALDALPEKRLIAGALQEGLTVERGPRDPLTWRQPVITIEHCAAANYHTGAPVPLNVCAIGAVGVKRGVDMSWHDPEQAEDDPALVNDKLAADFDIAHQLAAEVQYVNDECGTGRRVPLPRVVGPGRSTAWEYTYLPETPEERWARVRAWAVSQLHPDVREAFRLKNA